jgi:A/G-specific adenine glycosylase
MQLTPEVINLFRKKIYLYYTAHGRTFPWRGSVTPYHILVSEIMLQQTQTDRVLPKYEAFIKQFPDFSTLAHASQALVLAYWSGLGYNRRALYLHRCAQEVMQKHKGILPETEETLLSLPGIGPYTAAAIRTFAFNQPVVLIETNVRTVFIHEFFKKNEKIADTQLLPLIEQTLDDANPRVWYWALMDYGAMLKKSVTNPSRKSRHYAKQSKFVGSRRQIRGQILKLLLASSMTEDKLITKISKEREEIKQVLEQLEKEGFIQKTNHTYQLVQ